MCVCGQSVISADEISRAAKPEAGSNWLPRKKGAVRLGQGGKRFSVRVSFCHQETHLFKHARIALPINYFCIYLFYSVFILFLFFLLLGFYFLFNPHMYSSYKNT